METIVTRDGISLSIPDIWTEEQVAAAFTAALSLREQEKVSVLVANSINNATFRGHKIILEFATENVLLGLSTEQIAGLLQLLAPAKALLESGALPTAAVYLRTLTARPELGLSQERLDRFIQQIES